MPEGRQVRQDDETGERMSVTAQKKLGKELFAAMTGEDGPLAAGALPAIKAATENGAKSVFQALDDDNKTVARPKKIPKPKTSEPEEVVPKTISESGPLGF